MMNNFFVILLVIAGTAWFFHNQYDPHDPYETGIAAHERRDYATALRELGPLANDGHADAQFTIGKMFYYGQGVSQDYAATAQWLRLAAEPKWYCLTAEPKWYSHGQGHENAQYSLGRMTEYGVGVPQDDYAAREWYRLSAAQGNEDAQRNHDRMRDSGRGTPPETLLDKVFSFPKKTVLFVERGISSAKRGISLVEKVAIPIVKRGISLAERGISFAERVAPFVENVATLTLYSFAGVTAFRGWLLFAWFIGDLRRPMTMRGLIIPTPPTKKERLKKYLRWLMVCFVPSLLIVVVQWAFSLI